MNRLRQMSVFAHIVEAGSITAAAESLDLSKSVISQHLKALELDLGVSLLKRTTRRQTLTAAGQAFYQNCKQLNHVAESAWLDAQQSLEEPSGKITITAPNALMESLVTPAIAALLKAHPLLEPELVASDLHLDLFAKDIDLAIRVGPSKESSLKQRRIGQFRDVLCAHHRYMNGRTIQNASYIANAWQGKHISHQFSAKHAKPFEFKATARCISNSFHSCLSLIKDGAGIGLVPDFHEAMASKQLVEVFPEYQLNSNSVYALHPYSNQLPLSVKVCLNSIEQQLSKTTQASPD
ncbi:MULTISPECIES: LysR family transcriptional regulator [unclassified Agarivorans]|nr:MULTISPECIES: LysR substrate-binding domain-containing protein [unclassified Agarivorans]MDO6684365.1 LysR substrate-binding domain-containing protein [Agarivorans sp. 3_MG-2023]MDO6714530.1 LysR substrate-binding domain-containing protein [Agarivorans sp. 2_MG-2023]